MAQKRHHVDLDPDYEDVSEIQSKKRKVYEEGGNQQTITQTLDCIQYCQS